MGPVPHTHPGLYTDFYELTMAQGYFMEGMSESPAVFDYFFRSNPFDGGYVIFAGLADLAGFLERYAFDEESLRFLKEQGFNDNFLQMLGQFSFRETIFSVKEGEVVFPNEPCIRVEGSILGCQLIETLLLNIINFQTLIATKASRIRQAAGDRLLMEFGLRRAQGTGGMMASRAAIIGGFDATSNTHSGLTYGLKTSGTMAHSWVQSFGDEREAFRAYARQFPDQCILLVDTYDTLKSGIPHAIEVAREMEQKGHALRGIRIDSGDLAHLSKQARSMLDDAGLQQVRIMASNQLDETIIASLLAQNAPIDGFGIGTSLATGKPSASLDGVYKLSMVHGKPTMKISDNPVKSTLPGRKELYRYSGPDGKFRADAIALEGEKPFDTMTDQAKSGRETDLDGLERESLLEKVVDKGKYLGLTTDPHKIASFARGRFSGVPGETRRFLFPEPFPVGISPGLAQLRNESIF